MKKYITTFKTGMLLLLCLSYTVHGLAAGNDPVVEKRKVYNKTYSLSRDQKVSIRNSFGTVYVNNYKGSEVKVEVTMIAKAGTDAVAQSVLDNISIIDNNGSTVSFETKIDGNNNGNKDRKGGTKGMEVNYQVYMPDRNPLELQNEFGKTTVESRDGLTDITQKFGELNVGSLTNVEQVRVEFGSINAEKLSGGKTSFSYSEVKVKQFSGAVKSTLEFCSKTRLGIGSDVSEISINNSYSDIELELPADFNATYEIYTNFGDFVNNTDFIIRDADENSEDDGPKFDHDFKGRSGNGRCSVKIRSSFGKIKFS